jgi:arginine/lysine/ornithine decarboxylase
VSEITANTETTVNEVDKQLSNNPNCKVVVVVSPTYDGIVSDIATIANVAHKHNAILIVDEAHGSHFGFHPYFPSNSNQLGADIVIHSLHKTMPALTGASLLHMNGERVNRKKVLKMLGMLQTSSPSYVIMASIDYVIGLLADENKRQELFDEYVAHLENARVAIAGLPHIKLIETRHYDKAKILVNATELGIDGQRLATILSEDYHILMELSTREYAMGMTSIGDTKEGFDRLVRALTEISGKGKEKADSKTDNPIGNKKEFAVIEKNAEIVTLPVAKSVGYISSKTVYAYPPGSPVLARNEKITKEVVNVLQWSVTHGVTLEGLTDTGEVEVSESHN